MKYPEKSGTKYRAMQVAETRNGLEVWELQKRRFLFFWKTIEVGNIVKIINKCKKLNK